jgi:hydrogenase maturation protease
MGTAPGTIKRFTPEQAESVKKLTHYSLHEADILKILEISEKLGESPQKVVIFGIEPASLKPAQQLTSPLAGKIEEYISLILGELRE